MLIFYYCFLSTNCKLIFEYSFYNCDSILTIVLPTNLVTIGDNAFSYCDNLTNLINLSNVNKIGKDVFLGCNKLIESDHFTIKNSNQIINKYDDIYSEDGKELLNLLSCNDEKFNKVLFYIK